MTDSIQQIAVPSAKDRKVLNFSRQINNNQPFYVDVRLWEQSQTVDCFNNVNKYVELKGGEIIFGWAIWHHIRLMLEAEFHSVWKSPEGICFDITPKPIGFKRIFFLPDYEHKYDFKAEKGFSNKWYPLTEHPDFDNLVNVLQRLYELREKYPGIGEIKLTEEDAQEYYRLECAKSAYMQNIINYEQAKAKRRKPIHRKKSKRGREGTL